MKLGFLNEAEKHAKIVLMKNPVEPHANLNLGVIRNKRGDPRAAVRLYKREIKLNPGCLHAYYNLRLTHLKRTKWKAALPYLLKCYRRGYQAEHLDEDVARAARKSRNPRVEREVYRKELQKNPKNHWEKKKGSDLHFTQVVSRLARPAFHVPLGDLQRFFTPRTGPRPPTPAARLLALRRFIAGPLPWG